MDNNNTDINNKPYNEIKEYFQTYEDGKYKNFMLEKEDIEFIDGYAIFDIESKDQNKTLQSIGFCKNLGEDYDRICIWLLQNTKYYPGLLRPDLKTFIVSKKIQFAVMVSAIFDYIVLFKFFENKEDDVFQCYSLEYSQDKFQFANLVKATEYYYKSIEDIRKELVSKNNIIRDKLTNL